MTREEAVKLAIETGVGSRTNIISERSKKKFEYLKLEKYGMLRLLSLSHVSNKNIYALTLCDCGRESIMILNNVVKSNSSCGCARMKAIAEKNKTHGMKGTRTYSIWHSMRSRCKNVNHPSYKDYGGRGIFIDKRWDKFENFYIDMGDVPRGKSLDRIDNDRGYSKQNCRWATSEEQCNNRRNSKLYLIEGKSMSLPQWCRDRKMPMTTVKNRILRGMSIQQALGFK